jgi:hypothetical protein
VAVERQTSNNRLYFYRNKAGLRRHPGDGASWMGWPALPYKTPHTAVFLLGITTVHKIT